MGYSCTLKGGIVVSSIDVSKGMRNFECLLQGAYDEMIEILVMIDKAEQSSKWNTLFDIFVEDPDEAFENINHFLLRLKTELSDKGFDCTEEEVIKYLVRRKLAKI